MAMITTPDGHELELTGLSGGEPVRYFLDGEQITRRAAVDFLVSHGMPPSVFANRPVRDVGGGLQVVLDGADDLP